MDLLSEEEQMAEIAKIFKECDAMIYCNNLRFSLLHSMPEGEFYRIEKEYRSNGFAYEDLSTEERRKVCIAMCQKIAADHNLTLPSREEMATQDKDSLN